MSRKQRNEGEDFAIPSEGLKAETQTRQAKTFIPNQTETLSEVPEAITAGECLPHIPEYSGINLRSIPLKGLKSFLYASGLLLMIFVGWEVFTVLKSALETHWLLAVSFSVLLVLVTGLGLRALRNYTQDRENLGALLNIQKQANYLNEQLDNGSAKKFVEELKTFYADKPQIVYLHQCIEKLPDYSNDREVIDHIDRVFLQPLDKEALRRISNFSLQTGAAVAASPWASLDMLLSLWRSIKMIDDVAQVYGMRPSLANRYKLLKLVVHQLAFVGVSEVVIDQVMEEFGPSMLTGLASARVAQGLGAGIYTAKIGVAAMKVSRPIGFSKDNEPKAKSIIRPMIESLKGMMSGLRS